MESCSLEVSYFTACFVKHLQQLNFIIIRGFKEKSRDQLNIIKSNKMFFFSYTGILIRDSKFPVRDLSASWFTDDLIHIIS